MAEEEENAEVVPSSSRRKVGAAVAGIGVAAVAAAGVAFALRRPAEPTPRRGCAKSIVGGEGYACASLTDGRVVCWGNEIPSVKGPRLRPGPLAGFPERPTTLISQGNTLCMGDAGGSLWCAGANVVRTFGLPPPEAYSYDVVKHPLRDVRQVNWIDEYALTSAGLLTWNRNVTTATLVTGLPSPVNALAGNGTFTCLLLGNSEVWCRGSNLRGELGVDTGVTDAERSFGQQLRRDYFAKIPTLGNRTRQLASGSRHSCALLDDATVWCWGENMHGQIGKGDLSECGANELGKWRCYPSDGLVPTQVRRLPPDVTSIAVVEATSCALDRRGDVWCWGGGGFPTPSPVPVRLEVPEPVSFFAFAVVSACAIFRSGAVRCLPPQTPVSDWSHATEVDLGCR